jgi:hypothetical protein
MFNIIHHSNNDIDAIRFRITLKGAAEALASISFSLLYSAKDLL